MTTAVLNLGPTAWPLSSSVQSDGPYAGLLVQRVRDDAVVELFLYARSINFGDREQLLPVVYRQHLPAGVYRFTLIANGTTKIGLDVLGMSGVRIHPSKSTAAAVMSKDAAVGGPIPLAHADLPVPVQDDQLTVVIGAEEVAAAQASFIELCVTTASTCPTKYMQPWVTPGCLIDCETGIEQQMVYASGQLKAGRHAILVAGAGGVERFAGLLVVRMRQRPATGS